MKIAMVSKFPPAKDGIGIYSENLVKSILKNEDKKSSGKAAKKEKIKIVKIGENDSDADYKISFGSLFFYRNLKKIVEKENVDLVHIQYIAPWYGRITLNWPLIFAMKMIKVPVVVTLHEVQYDEEDKSFKRKVLSFIEKKIIRRAKKIIVHTPKQVEFIAKKYSTIKAEYIYMGVDARKNVPKKGKNILFFGMIGEGKGAVDLIKARKELQGFKIIIAGRPVTKEYENLLREEARNTDIELKFEWISEEKKDKLYRWASVVVLPYRWAPYQSAVLHDAFSYGVPVTVTKTGAVWELVDEFKCGEIVEPENPKMLAEGIKNTISKYKAYSKGVERYRKEASWDEVGKKYAVMYEKILSHSRKI